MAAGLVLGQLFAPRKEAWADAPSTDDDTKKLLAGYATVRAMILNVV